MKTPEFAHFVTGQYPFPRKLDNMPCGIKFQSNSDFSRRKNFIHRLRIRIFQNQVNSVVKERIVRFNQVYLVRGILV